MRLRVLLSFLVIALLLCAAVIWFVLGSLPPESPTRAARSGPVTVVLAGDTFLVSPLSRADRARSDSVFRMVQDSTVAIANLETIFGSRDSGADDRGRRSGEKSAARAFRDIGFNAVSCANNHTMDAGADGLTSTLGELSRLEIKAAGCGPDLSAARAPALIGERPRRVALLSIAASADPATRALDRQGIIAGRPGVSTLRYRVELHADAAAFDALSRAAGTQVKGPDELSVFGTRVLRSPKTRFEFIANEEDVAQLVTGVRTARRDADVVIVAVHAHEPINASLRPAGFVQQLARAAIDAGAQVVVGHGPHQLRGVERYKEGVILYSMGDFLSQRGAAIGKTTDAFDAGLDLEAVAIGAARVRGTLIQEPMAEPEWSESAIAIATFEGSGLKSLELIPLDLGLDRGASDRGLPQVAHGPTAARILSRLERLSSEFMTTVERRADRMTVRLN